MLPDTAETFHHWRRLIVTHEVKGAKVHDARLVAIMQIYGVSRLLTFNTGDFKRYSGIEVLEPV